MAVENPHEQSHHCSIGKQYDAADDRYAGIRTPMRIPLQSETRDWSCASKDDLYPLNEEYDAESIAPRPHTKSERLQTIINTHHDYSQQEVELSHLLGYREGLRAAINAAIRDELQPTPPPLHILQPKDLAEIRNVLELARESAEQGLALLDRIERTGGG